MKNKYLILFLLLNTLIINAQTIEQFAKKKAHKICNCLEELDYVDSRVDFELKLDACSSLSQKDSIRLKKIDNFDKYGKLIQSSLNNCKAIHKILEELRESYNIEASDDLQDTTEINTELRNKIIGQYSSGGGIGSVILTILDNNTYDVMSFGSQDVGKWKIVKEKYLHLIPARHPYPFYIYGRHNSVIKDSTKTAFLGDEFRYNTLIHYGKIKSNIPTFAPIFNKNANCFDYPFTHTLNGNYKEISLAYRDVIYTYINDNNYNDFIIVESIKSMNLKPTRAIIDDNKIIFRKNNVSYRRPIENKQEHIDLYKQFMEIPNQIYYNAGYKEFKTEIIHSDAYKFDKIQNVFSYTKEIKHPTDNLYDNIIKVNKYECLQDISKKKKQYKIGEKSIIYTVCGD